MIDVAAVVAGLAPRLLGHGVAYGDFREVTEGLARWSDWLPGWTAAADRHLEVAAEATASGDERTAAETTLRAAIYLHFAKFLSTEDRDAYVAATHRSVDLLRSAMVRLDPSFIRLEIPFQGRHLVANVRRPAGGGPAAAPVPAVILLPGLDSTKEEFPSWEASFLDRGLATISLDGPGQGETGLRLPLRADAEAPVGALLDAIAGRGDLGIDVGRVGITGIGMGGYFASRAAAFEPRLRAVGAVGGPYQFDRMPPLVRAKFLFAAGTADVRAAEELAAQFTLDGVAEEIAQPYFVVHGGRDAVMDAAVMAGYAAAAPRGTFLLYPTGSTACQSVSHLFRPRLADWFRRRLAA